MSPAVCPDGHAMDDGLFTCPACGAYRPSQLGLGGKLSPRALVALRHLDVASDAGPEIGAATKWEGPRRRVYAFQTADALKAAGEPYSPHGAANTLVALKRRGLAANDGGGCFVQARWWITPAGREALAGRS